MVTEKDIKKFIQKASVRLPAGIIANCLFDEINSLDPDIKEILSGDEVSAMLFTKLITHVLASAELDADERCWSRMVGTYNYLYFYMSERMIAITARLSYDGYEEVRYENYIDDDSYDTKKIAEEL